MATITSPANASVKAARKLARRRERAASGKFLVEGPNVVEAARGRLEQVFVADDADAGTVARAALAAREGAELLTVTPGVLRALSTTVTPQGVVGVAALPEPDPERVLAGAGFVLLCCGVADPGNAGAIVRTADAAGADAVLFSAGSVDPRNPKAVRASAGSLFHLPVASGVDERAVLAAARRHGARTVAADARGRAPHDQADLSGRTLLALGSEAHGLPAPVLAACDLTVRVEMHPGGRPGYRGGAESLNLAATVAVLAFEVARQRAGAARPRGALR